MRNVVITPVGVFFAFWDDEDEFGDSPPDYVGDMAAINFFRTYLEINSVTHYCGHQVYFERLQPDILYGFCQNKEMGIVVLPEPSLVFGNLRDNLSEDDTLRQFFDSNTNSRKVFDLLDEGQQILDTLDENSPSFDIELNRLREIIALFESGLVQLQIDALVDESQLIIEALDKNSPSYESDKSRLNEIIALLAKGFSQPDEEIHSDSIDFPE